MKRSLHLFLLLFLVSNASFLYAQTLLLATGSANTFSVTYPANFGAAIPAGTMFTFQSNQSITGTATLSVNGSGAFTIKKNYNQNLLANDIKTGHFVTVIFDGTNWQMLSISGNPGGGITGGGTASGIAFFTNPSTLTADGANFAYNNANYTSLSLGKILIKSTSASGDNLAIGANAGNAVMTGNSNSMYGQLSGNVLSTGNENSFFGTASGKSNAGGTYNSFFGSGSGYNNISGTSNSIFGSDAGYNNAGNDNVFIGRRAGITNNLGAKNVIIGSTADVNLSGLNNVIAIGYAATVGGPNMMALGGTGSNAVNVGIGTGTPANTLDINGGLTVRNLSGVGTNLVQVDNNGNFSLANSASNYVFGSGTASRLPYFVTSNTLLTSSQFLFDGSSIAIGGATLNGNLPFQVQATAANPGISGTTTIAAGTAIAGSSSNVAVGSIGVTGSSSGAGTGVNATNGGAGFGLYALNAGAGYAGFFQQNSTGYAAAFMGGKVGIGSSTPGVLLGVGTSAGFAVNNTGNIISVNGLNAVFPSVQGGANTFLRNDGVGNLTWVVGGVTSPWSVSGSNIFYNSGNVGIGTATAPGYNLDVANASTIINDASIHGLMRTNVTGSNWAYAIYGEGYGGNTGRVAGVYGFGVSTSTGYGVGVYGVASISGAGSGVLTGVWGEGSANNINDNYGIYGRAGNSSTNNYAISATVTASTGTSNNYGLYSLVNSVGANSYGVFVTVAGTATNKFSGVFMGGAVGIGTISPQMPLDVRIPVLAASTGAANPVFQIGSGDATPLAFRIGFQPNATPANRYTYIESFDGSPRNLALQPVNGNVGIGITLPGYKLHINEVNNNFNGATVYSMMTANTTGGSWSASLNGDIAGTGSSTETYNGVWGHSSVSTAAQGIGVYGRADKTAGTASFLYGVIGTVVSSNAGDNVGVYGQANTSTLRNIGLQADVSGTGGTKNYGVYSSVLTSGTNNYGILATVTGATNNYGGVFLGGPIVVGTVPSSIIQITNTGLVMADGHLRSVQATAPTIATGAAAGTSPSVAIANATDVAGKITITSGTGSPTAGVYATITLNKNYANASAIVVILTPTNLAAASKNAFISSTTTNTFVISFAAAAGTSAAHTFNYFVIETQ